MNRRFLYIMFYKPYGVLSQFTHEAGYRSLENFGPFPRGIYPVGRLDVDSEGLLLLTDDNQVNHVLTDPKFRHERRYLVQVELIPTQLSLRRLQEGVVIDGRETLPALVRMIDGEPALPERPVPIRFRRNVPTCWLEITLREGRNRQVRKMTAAIGHPTLRLVRTHISFLSLDGLLPGQTRALTNREVARLKEVLQTVQKQ